MILLLIDNKWYKSRANFPMSIKWEIYELSELIVETRTWKLIKGNKAITKMPGADQMNFWINGCEHLPFINTKDMVDLFYVPF